MIVPSRCPCCGGYTLVPNAQTTILVAVSDVLVVKALERVGTFLIRGDRSRWARARDTPLHLVHTLWQTPDDVTEKALGGAWDVVPALLDSYGCCEVSSDDVVCELDTYVHDLVLTGTPHTVDGDGGLEYRFSEHLGITIPQHEHADA